MPSTDLIDLKQLAVVQALELIQPNFIRRPAAARSLALGAVSVAAVLLAAVGVLFASTAPDGIEKLGQQTGIAAHARALISTPLSNYEATFLHSPGLSKTAAGLAGLALIYAACMLIGRAVARRRSA